MAQSAIPAQNVTTDQLPNLFMGIYANATPLEYLYVVVSFVEKSMTLQKHNVKIMTLHFIKQNRFISAT